MSHGKIKSTKSLLLNKKKIAKEELTQQDQEQKTDAIFGLEPWKTAKDGFAQMKTNFQLEIGIENYQYSGAHENAKELKGYKIKHTKTDSTSGKGSPNNRRKVKLVKDKSPPHSEKKKPLVVLKTDKLRARKSKEEIQTSFEKSNDNNLNTDTTKHKKDEDATKTAVDSQNPRTLSEPKKLNKQKNFLIHKPIMEQDPIQIKERLKERALMKIKRTEATKREKIDLNVVKLPQGRLRPERHFDEEHYKEGGSHYLVMPSISQNEHGRANSFNRSKLDSNKYHNMSDQMRISDQYELEKLSIDDEDISISKLTYHEINLDGKYLPIVGAKSRNSLNAAQLDLKRFHQGSVANSQVEKSPIVISNGERSFEKRVSNGDILRLEYLLPLNKEGFDMNNQALSREIKGKMGDINVEPPRDSSQILLGIKKLESAKTPQKIMAKINRGLHKGVTNRKIPRSLSIHELNLYRKVSQEVVNNGQDTSLLNNSIHQPAKQNPDDESKILLSSRSRMKSVAIAVDARKFTVSTDKCFSSFERLRGSVITTKGIRKAEKNGFFLDTHLQDISSLQGQLSEKIIRTGPLQMMGVNLVTLQKGVLDKDIKDSDINGSSFEKRKLSPQQLRDKKQDPIKAEQGKLRHVVSTLEIKQPYLKPRVRSNSRPASGALSRQRSRIEQATMMALGQEHLTDLQLEGLQTQKGFRNTPDGLDSFKMKIIGSKAKYSDREGNQASQAEDIKSNRVSQRKSVSEERMQREVESRISKHRKQLSEIIFESQHTSNTTREKQVFK